MNPHCSSKSASGKTPLRVLFFEDDTADMELSLRALRSSEYDVTSEVAVTPDEFLEHVHTTRYDVILSDFRMPSATGMDIFDLVKREGLTTPFILVTGSLGDEKAVECLKEGVADYVIKDRIARLPVAIGRALEERQLRIQRSEAIEALRKSEASYRSLIQSAPCGILRLSATDGRLLEVNTALCEMLGYPSPRELIESSVAGGIALDPDVLERLTLDREPAPQLVATEVEWKRKDGTPLVIGLSGRLLRDRTGTPTCLEMIAENITDRRLAQERIRQLNRLYSVLSHAGRAIVRLRTWSQLCQEICRIIVEEGRFQMAWVCLVGAETPLVAPIASFPITEDYLTGIQVSTDAREEGGRGPIGKAIRGGLHVISNDLLSDVSMRPWLSRAQHRGYRAMGAFPILVRGRSGALAIYSCEKGAFDAESVALLDELAADLSFGLESIELEQMHHRAVDERDQFFALSLDLLCITNLEGYIHRLNPAWEKTLGFSAAELCSQPWIEFVHPEDRAQAEAALLKLQSGIELNGLELRFLSKSGAYRWLVGSATPALEQKAVFAAMSDITERKYLEEKLRAQNVSLEQQIRLANEASRLKSEFLANMSHELRSPLNGILGFTELLYDGKLGPLPERPRIFLGRIHASASHLLQLINSVLDLSKVEAGRLEFRPERVSLPDVIQEVTGILATLAAEKEIRVETRIEPEVNEVTIDGGRLKQILYNYLSNALKFTGPGGRVKVKASAEGADEFRIEVSDSGLGIAEKDLPRLFVEFQQLDATTSKRYQGTGLGLALTKRIVEAQGGRVGVESTPGKGSTFFAVLSRVPMTDAGVPKILAVEDHRVHHFQLTRALDGAGYAVETAASCEEAVEKCRPRSFDAILIDLPAPDGPAWEALRRIRSMQHHRNTPVFVVSEQEKNGLKKAADQASIFQARQIRMKDLLPALEGVGLPMRGEWIQDEPCIDSDRG